VRPHLDDLRLGVDRVRDDAGLRASQRDCLVAEVVDHHRGQGARDALAGRDEHVQLARVRPRRDLVGEVEELVRRPAHRRQHGDDSVTSLARGDEPPGDALQLLRVADGRAAELHHHRPERPCGRVGVDGGDGLVIGAGHTRRV
jgi:hypothetical protein